MSVPQPPMGSQPVGGAPQWGPQQPWGTPPGPPPSGGGKGKWIFAGIALVAVIAVTVVITVLVIGKDPGNSPSPTPTPSSGTASGIASANDKGPATIITELEILLAGLPPTWTCRGRLSASHRAASHSCFGMSATPRTGS